MRWYGVGMRTTIDIPPGLHDRIKDYARQKGTSFSSTAVEALMRGMAPIESGTKPRVDPVTGLLVFSSNLGHKVTSEEVADLIDEDEW